MNVALWIGQVLLAAIFAVSGTLKSTQSKERMLATGQTGVAPFPLPVIRLVAACELLGVLGPGLPRLTGIAPALTPAAAAGLGCVMIGAAVSHAGLGEWRTSAVNIAILAICVFVLVGRLPG